MNDKKNTKKDIKTNIKANIKTNIKKNKTLITNTARCCAVALAAAALTSVCTACNYTGIPFVDKYIDDHADDLASYGKSYVSEHADDLASYGKSYVSDHADDLASYGKSYVSDHADDYASMGKSYAAEKSSDLFSEASSLISKLISAAADGGNSSDNGGKQAGNGADSSTSDKSSALLTSPSDINLNNPSGDGKNYVFSYGEEQYSAVRWEEHWKIIDSYKIDNTTDMVFICQALIDVYPIHGVDMVSYRTADDMAYEWVQHNLAYEYLPEDNTWRNKAKDVDFNPEDQGKSFIEIYEERTGKEFNWSDVFGS